jgi:hypothetical protein
MHYTELHKPPVLHIVLTIIAYVFFLVWLFLPRLSFASVSFIMIWFLAVVDGADIL